MADIIQFTDLPTSLTASMDQDIVGMMLDGLNAQAVRVAPCLNNSTSPAPTADQLNEAKLILFSAITRWINDGSSNLAPEGAAPRPSYRLWPSEIATLQAICEDVNAGAFSVDTLCSPSVTHASTCSLLTYVGRDGAIVFGGANYCDCGADIAGVPMREAF